MEQVPQELRSGKGVEDTKMLEVQEHVRKAISELEEHLKAGKKIPGEQPRETEAENKKKESFDKAIGVDTRYEEKEEKDGKGKEIMMALSFIPRRGPMRGESGGMSVMFGQSQNRVRPRSPPELIKQFFQRKTVGIVRKSGEKGRRIQRHHYRNDQNTRREVVESKVE
jgi:hypothetical protein